MVEVTSAGPVDPQQGDSEGRGELPCHARAEGLSENSEAKGRLSITGRASGAEAPFYVSAVSFDKMAIIWYVLSVFTLPSGGIF